MSQPVHTLTSAEFVGDVTGAMQMAAEGNTVLITDGGEPAWLCKGKQPSAKSAEVGDGTNDSECELRAQSSELRVAC